MTTNRNQKINHAATPKEMSRLQQELQHALSRVAALEGALRTLNEKHQTTRHATATIGVFLYGTIDNAYAACGRF
jgi:predicted  nucleic acid-binding Zn-ribbon protein